MRDEDWIAFHDGVRDHDGGIRTAVEAWCADRAAAKAKYGHIASWDTSAITDMDSLFMGRADFNEDISRWDVSNVKDMRNMFRGATSFNGDLSRWDVGQVTDMTCMFNGATSFNGQLGGTWSESTAHRGQMFRNSPGTIVGRTKLANGTIE